MLLFYLRSVNRLWCVH